MAADDANPGITKRKQETGCDEASQDAYNEAEPKEKDKDSDGQRNFQAGTLAQRDLQCLNRHRIAKQQEKSTEDRRWHQLREIQVREDRKRKLFLDQNCKGRNALAVVLQ